MFKIENYIAPLILSKVEKFVKNINQQDLQVSLWQGDVVFQNLELKLDVLEEELQLPFTFLSGSVRDLKIQIPWTKIASESIIFTINTIELVVKLKDFSSSPPPAKPKLKKKISVDEDSNGQAGYMASLIAKILGNMSVICNNIVLKFIEEDIVLTMNIQHLSVHSADHRWRRSFIDVSPTNVLFRKLINIIDLTICLDKRNSSGKIEFVQEPLLYKCSMELRLYRKHNATNPLKLSLTRIDVQTNALNLNVSSQQLPMLLRLYDLTMALKSGKLQAKYSENLPPPEEGDEQGDDESWLHWAWNMIPALLPDEQTAEGDETGDKKIFEFGLYVEDIHMSLKAQEFLSDPIIPSTKKAVFKPLLSIHAQEFFSVTIISGVRKFNVKCGVGFVEVTALEECVCGVNVTDVDLLTAGDRNKTGSYLKDSFMDKDAATMPGKYEGMWENYYEKNSEETMLLRTPAMAIDILHIVELPDDAKSSDVGSDLEFSNFSEAYKIRVFGNKVTVKAGAEAMHRIERIVRYYKDCDFLPYVEVDKPLVKSQLSPATADDYDALITEVPVKIVSMKLKNLCVVVKEWDHHRRRKVSKVKIEIKIDEACMELKLPLYKNRLIYTACQLPDNELFDKCFMEVKTSLKSVKIDMKFEGEKRICEVSSLTTTVKKLIYPHLWAGDDVQENFLEINVDNLTLLINPAQLLALKLIISSMVTKGSNNEIERDVLKSLEDSNLVVIQLVSQKLRFTAAETSSAFFAKFSISDVLGIAWKSGKKSLVVNFPDGKRVKHFAVVNVQHPKVPGMLKATEMSKLLPVVTIILAEGSVNFDPLFREFLSFEVNQDEMRTSSTITTPAVNDQLPSMQSSSDCDVTICPQNPEKEVEKVERDWVEVCRSFIVNVELKPVKLFYTMMLMESSKPSDSLQALLTKTTGQLLALKTPNIVFHSVKNKSMLDFVSRHFTVELPANLWGNEKVFTWNLVLGNLTAHSMEKSEKFELIEDLSLNISIADETPTGSDVFTGNLLIETSPVVMTIHTSQVKLIRTAIDEVLSFPMVKNRQKVGAKMRERSLSVIHESPQNTSEIKEFLGLATGSTTTKTSHADDRGKKQKSRCSLYVQWVCSKITLTFLADNFAISKKFMFEIDEILFSLHQQDFYQLKSKIASISGSFSEKIDDKWTKNITLGLSVQCDENISDNANRFLDLTITKAETVNVHSRWNVGHKRNRLYNDDITEINIVVQPLDIIVDLDELVNFSPIFEAFKSSGSDEKPVALAGSELPLIFFMCSGFRIFLPCLQAPKTSSDVMIVKIGNIHVTPTAVNNLIRSQILRPDIHSKACSLGILDLAGSKIEDRQYQLTVSGVSLSTSSWDGIAALITEKTIIETSIYDNPAFEWNNLENGPKSPNFKLQTIFKDSTFSFIYAPCIRFKETLVAGIAMEFNCVNDMSIEVTLKELGLMMKVLSGIGKVFSKKTKVSNPLPMTTQHPLTTTKKIFEKDSGVESLSVYKKTRRELHTPPFEFTFTSSKFKLRCSENGGDDNTIIIVLDTPNIFITQDRYEKSVNLSLHDLFVMHGVEKLFVTKDGAVDTSGIKPSLLRVKFSEKSTVDVTVKRPILMEFSHEKLEKILKLLELLEVHGVFKGKKPSESVVDEKLPEATKHVNLPSNVSKDARKHSKDVKNTPSVPLNKKLRKFDVIKSKLRDIKALSVLTTQIVVNIASNGYNFKLALSDFKGKLRAFDRPEKIEVSTEINNLMFKNHEKFILHPLTLQAKVKVAQEYWKTDPMMHVNIEANFIRLDFNLDLLNDFKSLQFSLQEVLDRRKINTEAQNPPTLPRRFIFPPTSFKNSIHSTVEHFQDDLRSGAFQFIESASLRDLPLPYQIQIIDNDVGVICWRYPLPRALHKIKIFPVPFQTNQVTIVCKIEFYSQLKSQFEEFCEFTLAENETKLLDLKQNRPLAEVWRIKIPRVLLKRDSDDEDESGDYEFQMHPKVLVACLRIDSYYVSSAVPNIDLFVDVKHIEVNVMNKMEKEGKKLEVVEGFQLLDDRGREHEAGKLKLKRVKLLGSFFDENYKNFEVDATISAEIIDYGCGNLVPMIDEFRFKTLLDLHHGNINVNLMTDKVQLKYSPSIGHSLLMTRRIWESREFQLHTKFIVCNNTANPVGISQSQTNEMICLMPQSFVLYHFRTDKLEQTLQLCVCLKGAWSVKTLPISVHSEGVEFVKLEDNQVFVVTVKSVTNYQRRITIDGAVAIFNMTKEVFRVQYKRYDKDIDSPDKSESLEFDVDGHRSGSVFGTCVADSQQSIRLRMAKMEKKVLSGEIPLREIVVNNKPWLVKVPSMAIGGFTSFWVRIIRETKNEISRVLVMIWPMFVTKSLLPINATAFEAAQNEDHLIVGRGETRELDMSGTHEDEHELLLKGNYAMLDDDEAKVMLSYKLINRNSFFKIPDEFSDVNKAIEKLEMKLDEKWPCARDEEFRSHRDVTLNGPILPVYHLSSQTPEELSCSLMLTLAPWCSIINSTGCLLKLTNLTSTESCTIEVNNISMPFYINNTFTITIETDGATAQSEPIYINTDLKRTIFNSFSLPIEGQLHLTLQTDTEILQLLVTSSIENKMRLIVISSLVVVVNHSRHDLNVFAFAADVGEKLDGIKRNEVPTRKFKVVEGSSREKGRPIVAFEDVLVGKGKRKVNTNFSLLIAISGKSDDTSFPIKLQPTMRKCLNVPGATENFPVSVSIVKHNEQFFVSIYDDSAPFISIRNDTDFNLYVAQTDVTGPNVSAHREVADDRFSWFQAVPSKQRIFYTPPVVNEHFPEIINPDYGLVLACVTGDDFGPRWSQPVKIDGTKKIIINVPMFGDVKLTVDVSDKIARFTIGYVKDEVTDIRRDDSHHSFLDINRNYQKTFSVARQSKSKALNVNFYSRGVSFTIYKDAGRQRVEMITLNLDDIGIKHSKLSRKLKINFSKVQVDNELFPSGEYDFPVVLCNKDLPKMPGHDVAVTSIWDLNEIIDEQENQEMFSVDVDLYEKCRIENVVVKLQPIRVYIEDTFINFLLEIVDDCLPTNLMPKSGRDDARVKLENGFVLVPIAVMSQAMILAEPLRLKSIRLEPLHILLSVHTCMRMYIALDHSPLDFSAYEKLNVYTLPMKLGNSMGMHYLSSAIFGAGWVVGSLEILGSPSGLARSFTSGFKDFVSMPVQGLFKGPWGFLVGLTQGSVSLVSHVTTGTVNSVTKLATSLARNLDRLTLDNDHIHLKTDASRRHRPQGLTEGLQQGLTGFGISILGAIGGLARHPLQAKTSFEVFTGVGKGIVGVFAKPISGAAEFVALTGTGMLQSVGYNLLPLPISHHIENCLMEPTRLIINKQLPQYASSNVVLFTCCGTFSRKNDIKNSFIVLMSSVMVIADLDRDMVMDVIPIERIQPVHKAGSADNLFVFKIKDDDDSPTNHEQKYPVSNRTVQYIQQLSGHQLPTTDENSEEEKLDADEIESLTAIGSDKKISFYMDEVTGRYLVAYVNLIKGQIQAKNNLFPLFEA